MPRLPRPKPPLPVKLDVAMRQIGFPLNERRNLIEAAKAARTMGPVLESYLIDLANRMGCPRSELQLDHDPALENRQQLKDDAGEIVGYLPAANDPEYLCYRPFSGEYEGSHYIKTNVRGANGQFSDNMLAKRERKRKRKANPRRPKQKIPQRKNPWPPRGSRKMPSRGKI
jgi:hypothetical protein